MHNTALRHGSAEDIARLNRGESVPPERIYFRCWPRLASSAPELAWLNTRLAVGVGERQASQPASQVTVRIFILD